MASTFSPGDDGNGEILRRWFWCVHSLVGKSRIISPTSLVWARASTFRSRLFVVGVRWIDIVKSTILNITYPRCWTWLSRRSCHLWTAASLCHSPSKYSCYLSIITCELLSKGSLSFCSGSNYMVPFAGLLFCALAKETRKTPIIPRILTIWRRTTSRKLSPSFDVERIRQWRDYGHTYNCLYGSEIPSAVPAALPFRRALLNFNKGALLFKRLKFK